MRSYTVIGLGAIGGYYGARLHQAGHPVRFLARSDADHVRAHGLRVDSFEGDVVLAVDVHDDAASVPPSDAVIVAVKTTATTGVLDLIAPLVAPGGSVLVMQNGLGVDAVVAAALADDVPVLGVMCFMCSNKVGPGHIHHLDQGAVAIGEHRADGSPAGVTPAVEAAVADLTAARVEAQALGDLETGRWKKLVWNMAFNGLSVTEDAETDRMVSDPALRTRAIAIMSEVVNAADACGHGFDPAFVDRMVATTEAMTPYKPSMKLDFEAGRALELDAIYAAPIAAARGAGVDMPLSAALLAELRALDPGTKVMSGQWHLDAETYLSMVRAEVPSYDRLQTQLAEATADVAATRILDLGTGTGVTAAAVLARHPDAALVGLDASADVLAQAHALLPGATFVIGALEDRLPRGPFDLVVSALAIHHLAGDGKADLFRRVAAELRPGGCLVWCDVVVPAAAVAAPVPLEAGVDRPDPLDDQLGWMAEAGFVVSVVHQEHDLAIVRGDLDPALRS